MQTQTRETPRNEGPELRAGNEWRRSYDNGGCNPLPNTASPRNSPEDHALRGAGSGDQPQRSSRQLGAVDDSSMGPSHPARGYPRSMEGNGHGLASVKNRPFTQRQVCPIEPVQSVFHASNAFMGS